MFKKMDYVLEINRQKSFTKAAEKLYISQPCLSAAVKEIEKQIGYPLFERRYSGLKLTEIGAEYVKTAEQICTLKDGFIMKTKAADKLESGKLNVGGSNYIMSYVLPKVVKEFSLKYPKIEIVLTEGNSIELENKLEKEEIDILIDSSEPASGQESHQLITENILLAVPEDYEINKELQEHQIFAGNVQTNDVGDVSISRFKNEKFILLKKGHNMRSQADTAFNKAGIYPEICYCLDQLSTSYNLASTGNGVCFITDTMFKFHKINYNVVLYKIKECTTRSLFVSKKKNRFSSPAMERFIETARKVIN